MEYAQNTTPVFFSQYGGSLFAHYVGSSVEPMNFGKRLKSEREARRWTQHDLAERSGVSQASISRIERGDQAQSVHTPALASALGLHAHWLASGKGPRLAEEMAGARGETTPEDAADAAQTEEELALAIAVAAEALVKLLRRRKS